VGVRVGGTGVAVGGTGVAVGSGVGVLVGGTGVGVGSGVDVRVGGTRVAVGSGVDVPVGGEGVGLDKMVGVKAGRGVTLCVIQQADSEMTMITEGKNSSMRFLVFIFFFLTHARQEQEGHGLGFELKIPAETDVEYVPPSRTTTETPIVPCPISGDVQMPGRSKGRLFSFDGSIDTQ